MTVSSRPMRVLQIVTNMSYGGLENLLMNYYRNIDRNKIQFDFLTHFAGHQDFEEEIAALGGRLYRLPRLNPFSRTYHRALNQFFDNHPEYTTVHCHLDCMAGIPLKAAKAHGIPARIAHSHNSNQTKDLKYPIKLYYRNKILPYATQLFACSRAAGDWMFCGADYTVMSNAIDSSQFRFNPRYRSEIRQAMHLSSEFTIGHVGQFREQKNHLFLLRIFSEILNRQPDSKLVLVGKGPMMDPAKQLAQELGIQNHVIFLGARPDIPQLMQAMDAFVLPSLYEGLPVTMVEAQAAGLPCFISDKVPGECVLTDLVRQISLDQSPDIWAKAILKCQNISRRDYSSKIINTGFDIHRNTAWLEEVYLNGRT